MDPKLLQAGAAFTAGTVAEYAKRYKGVQATGLLTSLALLIGGYWYAPSARGNTLPVVVGLVDGAASWLGSAYMAPVFKTGFFGYSRPAPLAAPVAAFGGFGRRGVSITEI